MVGNFLPAARDALERHSWNEAYELLSQADKNEKLSAADLESMAEAAWWTGHPEETYDARERAFNGYIEDGEPKRAALMALLLARDHFQKNDSAVGGGWFMRGERLLEGQEDSHEYGYLSMMRALGAESSGEFEAAVEQGELAMQAGMKFADKDLQAYGLALQGSAKVAMGHVDAGMGLVDEATVAAVSGELGPMATGIIYCMTISICRDLADYRRAGEWTEAAKRWCERQSINGFPGVCRVHRAEIIALQGSWAEAEQEARRASDELMRFNLANFAAIGHYEIGEIRLRMGDFPAAEESFRIAHEMGKVPQPGLALLWLAQGKTEAAAQAVKRALAEEPGPLVRARLLPGQVEISLACGDIETARAAADEFASIAETYGRPALHAGAHYCRAQVALADGDLETARRNARQSLKHFSDVDLPYEIARARVLVGLISRAEGNEDEAGLEWSAAINQFEKLGAQFELRRTQEIAGSSAAPSRATGERVVMTFMFTDIVKSTNLIEAIGDEAWEDLIRWHDKTLRSILAEHRGQEIRHQGDGFFVAFENANDAVECATRIQRALVEHRKSQGFAPQVRIGMHTSEATRRGLDYAGAGIHEAARIGSLAEGGEILVSRKTLDSGSARCKIGDARAVTLKGIAEPVEVLPIDWR